MDRDPEQNATGTTGAVSRSQNQLHVLPEDWHAGAHSLEPWLDRIDPDGPAPQALIITNDVDAAAGLARRLGMRRTSVKARIAAATDARRALRVVKTSPPHAIVAAPEVILQLMRSAALKLDDLRVVALAWIDDLGVAGTEALEAIMAEIPKDAARLVLAAHVTPEVEQLVERYARRARRVQAAGGEALPDVSLSYHAVGDVARPMALRRILDAFDPESAYVVVRSDQSREEVEAHLASLGYGGEASPVRFGEEPDDAARLIVLYDFPASDDALRRMVSSHRSARVIALVAPRQLATLRRWAGGSLAPLSMPDAAQRAQSREERLREEIRGVLRGGQHSREVLTLEPLLADHDGVEVAAALLRLLEAERMRPQASSASEAPAMTKVVVNIGEMDNVRPGDLVGAITNEAGISRAEVGRVEVRERHSVVEVATAVADTVVTKVTGATIRGRRAIVKVDEPRERRESGARRDGGRGAPRRDRPSSPRPARPPRPR